MIPIDELTEIVPHLRCYARAMVGNLSSADGMVSECLMIFMKAYPDIDADEWRFRLFTLLHDLIVEVMAGEGSSSKEAVPARGPPFGSHVADGHEAGLQRAFADLSFLQRAVLFLVVFETFSVGETAVIAHMPVRKVKRILREALDQLSVSPLSLLALRGTGSR